MSGRAAAAAALLAIAGVAFVMALGIYRRMTVAAAAVSGGILAPSDAGRLALCLAAIGAACAAIGIMALASEGEAKRSAGRGAPGAQKDGGEKRDRPNGEAEHRAAEEQAADGKDPLMD